MKQSYKILITAAMLVLLLTVFPLHFSLASAQNTIAIVTFNPLKPTLTNGSTNEIQVEIQNVKELYAFDISIKFDPTMLQIIDLDPAKSGIQIAQGPFLEAGIVVINEVDSNTGKMRFVMTQLNPSLPKSGSGGLLVLRFGSKTEGVTRLTLEAVQLSTRAGIEIPATVVNSDITINNYAPAGPTATFIPVATQKIDLTQVVPNPGTAIAPTTSAQTQPAATSITPAAIANQNSSTPTKSQPVIVTVATSAAPQPTPVDNNGNNNWVILVVLVVVVAGLFFVWLRTRDS